MTVASTHPAEQTERHTSSKGTNGRPRLRVIRTLNPSRLQPSDLHDVSGLVWASYHVDPNESFTKIGSSLIAYSPSNKIPFPPGTRGFLYYFSETSASPTRASNVDRNMKHGQIRFRVMPPSDATAFEDGEDLQLPTGMPWQTYVNQRRQATSRPRVCLRELMVRDGYISETESGKYRQSRRGSSGPAIARFGQPFYFNFSVQKIWWTIVSQSQGGKTLRAQTMNPLRSQGINTTDMVYTGKNGRSSAHDPLSHPFYVVIENTTFWYPSFSLRQCTVLL